MQLTLYKDNSYQGTILSPDMFCLISLQNNYEQDGYQAILKTKEEIICKTLQEVLGLNEQINNITV